VQRSAIARASRLPRVSLDCGVIGTLDRVDRAIQFTHFEVRARLAMTCGESADRARYALEKAGRICLISSSPKASIHLEAVVETADPVAAPLAS
jgi:hypothetical protein